MNETFSRQRPLKASALRALRPMRRVREKISSDVSLSISHRLIRVMRSGRSMEQASDGLAVTDDPAAARSNVDDARAELADGTPIKPNDERAGTVVCIECHRHPPHGAYGPAVK